MGIQFSGISMDQERIITRPAVVTTVYQSLWSLRFGSLLYGSLELPLFGKEEVSFALKQK